MKRVTMTFAHKSIKLQKYCQKKNSAIKWKCICPLCTESLYFVSIDVTTVQISYGCGTKLKTKQNKWDPMHVVSFIS